MPGKKEKKKAIKRDAAIKPPDKKPPDK